MITYHLIKYIPPPAGWLIQPLVHLFLFFPKLPNRILTSHPTRNNLSGSLALEILMVSWPSSPKFPATTMPCESSQNKLFFQFPPLFHNFFLLLLPPIFPKTWIPLPSPPLFLILLLKIPLINSQQPYPPTNSPTTLSPH